MQLRSPVSRRDFLTAAGALALGGVARRAPAAAPLPTDSSTATMAGILARIRPPEFPGREFRVTAFGATAGGAKDARPGILAAIKRCSETGGGCVIVPDGEWRLDGPIHLCSNVHLKLADRAHLRFRTDTPELYLPVVLTRWEGTEVFNYSPFIYAYLAHNVALTGGGTIDGQAHDTFVKWRPRQNADQQALRKMGAAGAPVASRVFGLGHWLRPPLVQFFGCTNVLVDGPRLIDSPLWVIHAVGCSNVTVRRVRVESPHLNSDGFDPESCADVLVEDCVFKTGDDCIAIKSGRDQDGWRIGRPTENVVIRRCELQAPTSGSGLAIGSELSGGVRHVFVESVKIGSGKAAIVLKANLDRGGGAEQIVVRDVAVERTDLLLQVTTDYKGHLGGNFPPTFRGLHFEKIHCANAEQPISAVGVPEAKLQDITLREISVLRTGKPPVLRHVRNFRAENVVLNGQLWQPARDVD